MLKAYIKDRLRKNIEMQKYHNQEQSLWGRYPKGSIIAWRAELTYKWGDVLVELYKIINNQRHE